MAGVGIDAPAVAVHVGVDIGQKVDPTAIVVVEVSERKTERTRKGYEPNPRTGELYYGRWPVKEAVYTARHMERLPLNTSYPDVAARIVAVLVNLHKREWEQRMRNELAGPLSHQLYLDATGVGQPVVDIVRAAMRSEPDAEGCTLHALTFTHGDTYDRSAGRLGKAFLVSRLQALLQTRCLLLPPQHPEATAMALELKDYEIKIDAATANDTYGAFKVGTHDDLVTALGLAVLDDPSRYRVTYMPKPPGW